MKDCPMALSSSLTGKKSSGLPPLPKYQGVFKRNCHPMLPGWPHPAPVPFNWAEPGSESLRRGCLFHFSIFFKKQMQMS